MSRLGARHIAIAIVVLATAVGAALWALRPDAETGEVVAAPAVQAPPAEKRHTGPRGRRTSPAEVAASSSSADARPPVSRVDLTVKAVDATTRSPLPGVAVYAIDGESVDWRAETGDDGVAHFDELPPGSADIRAEADGRIPIDRHVAFLPGKPETSVELALAPGFAVTGRVVDGDGRAVAGATVGAGADAPPVPSGPDGSFTIEHLAAGAAVIVAGAPGRVGSVLVPDAASAGTVTVGLGWMGVLRGTVVDAAGAAVPGAAVSVRDCAPAGATQPGRVTTVVSGAAGKFQTSVAAGKASASAGGKWVDVDVPEGGEASATVVGK